MRTTFYLSRVRNSKSRTKSNYSQDIDDDDLFTRDKPRKSDPEFEKRKLLILKWLQQVSSSLPQISYGLSDSIVNWFLQSGPLLPKVLFKNSKKTSDLVSTIKFLNEKGVLTEGTLNFMTNSVETAPPEELVWSILNDVYNYAIKQQTTTIPLTKTAGENPPLVLQRSHINQILGKLGLQRLPDVFTEPKEIVDDVFRNGTFLFTLYEKLTNEKVQPVSLAVSQSRAIKNTQIALTLFETNKFIDPSFTNCASEIVSGDQFALQHLLSMIFYNCARINGPISIKSSGSQDIQQNQPEGPKSYLDESKLHDGITLPKLLTAIDPHYAKLPYLLLNPLNDIEKKWNLRKTVEYLERKPAWPSLSKLDINNLIDGEQFTVEALYKGIVACYPQKFLTEASCKSLKAILGLL